MNYRDLQEENYINQTGGIPLQTQNHLDYLLQQQRSQNPYNPLMTSSGPVFQSPLVVQSPASGSRGYGESQYDRRGIGLNQEEFGHIDDLRARNQSAIDQLSNGIAKGTVLAGTTLFDGTLGMLYGIGAAVNRGELSGLWDNEVSNTLHDVNQQMEDYFQNYLTDEAKRNEAKGQWYKNLDTVNWWAENVVKNAGFMVGAYYSGLGWSKLLGALGKTILAAKSAPNFVLTVGRSLNGGIARAAMGVFASALNEGRIEANNNSTDAFNIKAGQLENAFTEQQASIMNNPLYSDEEKEILIKQLQDTKAQRYQELDEMRRNMGTADMIMNLPILAISETIAWARAFAGGSKAVLKANVLGSGTKHIGDNVSKVGMAVRGLGRGVSEGMEEMNQAAASNISGYRLMPSDSPDAWHLALIDPESNLKTMDTYNSILESLKETYGKGASWQEFVAGAIPGLGGLVTIGKSNNMSDETWLGRGKFIGLTGGIGGSIYGDIRQNRINDEYAEYMNKYFGKRQTELRDIARTMSFNDGAETAAFNGDTFELKNQEDNDFFAAVSRFNAAGRLSELKESLTGPLGEIIDEAKKGNAEPLANLVTSTINPERRTSPWIDGFQASDDTELRTKIADAVNNPKQRKYIIDKLKAKKKFIEDGIDRFSTIRDNFASQYPMLQDQYIDELSWLKWKNLRFSDRAKDVADKKKDLFSLVRKTITDLRKEIQKERDAFIQAHPDPNALSADDRLKDAKLKKDISDAEYNEEFIEALESNDLKEITKRLINTAGIDEFLSDGLIDQLMRDSGLTEDDISDFKTNVRELQKLIQMRELFVKRLSQYLMKSYEEKKTQLEQADSVKKKMDEAHEQLEVKRDVQLEILKNRKYQEEIDAIDSYRGFLDALDAHRDNKEWRDEAMATSPYGQMKLAYDAATSELTLRIAGILANGGNPGFRLPVLNYINKAFENSHSVEEALDINNPVYQDIEGLGDYLYTPNNMPQYTREATYNFVLNRILDNLNKAIKALDLKQKASTPEYNPQPTPLPQDKGKGKGRGKGRNQGQQMYEEDLDLDKQQEKIKGKKGIVLRSQSDKGSPTDREKSGLEFDPIPSATAKKLNAALDVIFQDPDKIPQYKGDIIKILKKQVIDKSKAKNKNYNLEQFIGEYLESRDMSIPEAWNLKYTPRNGSIDDASEPGRVDYDASDTDSKPSNPSIEYIKKKRVASENKSSVGKKKYLRSNTTQYALYNADDEKTGTLLRYSDLLKERLKAKGLSDEAILSNPLYKRLVAVEQYLERTGAYERVNSGYVHAGKNPTEIFFTIDPALNAQAGTTVILMVDKDGNVLGDMPTNAEEYENLPLVIEAITKEWENAGSPNLDANWRFSKSTKVAQVLNGRPIYTSEHHSVGDIKGKDSNIVYGIVKNNLVITGIKEIDDNNQVQTPLGLASGTPVICIPNGNFGNQSGYTTVPIYIPNFTVEGESKLHNTKLFETIMNNIQAVVQAKTVDQLKNAVKNLSRNLYLPGYDFYLLVDQNGKLKRMNTSTQGDPVKIGVQVFENGKPKSILAPIDIVTDVNDPNNSRDQIAQALNGAMIRLRRYVMNSAPATLYDLDYRALYDEAFETNLPENTRHTVNNWFICDPINLEGENPPAEKIASLGVNPTGVEARLVAVTIDGKRYIVDISNEYKVTLDDVEVQDADEVRARAQAYKEYTLTGKNPIVKKGGKKVYQTNYGEIDAETLKFYPIKKAKDITSQEPDEDDLQAIIAQLQGRGASLKPSKPVEVQEDKPNQMSEPTDDEDDLEALAQLAASLNGAPLGKVDTNNGLQLKSSYFPKVESIDYVNDDLLPRFRVKVNDREYFLDWNLHHNKWEILGIGATTNDAGQVRSVPLDTNIFSPFEMGKTAAQVFLPEDYIEFVESGEFDKLRAEDVRNGTTKLTEYFEQRGVHYHNFTLAEMDAIVAAREASEAAANAKSTGPVQGSPLDLSRRRAERNKRRGGANRQYRVAEVRNPKQKIDVDKELNWLKKRLPQFDDFVQLRNGLIENRAWGQFENGIITLSTDSGVGTTYHEAFHAVSLTLLTQEEREAIYKAARERFGNLSDVELEEKLAEDFREYVQYEESGLIGKLRHIWRKLQHMINQLFGNMDVLNKLYYDINNGSYASRVSLAEAQQYQNIRAYHTAKFMYSNLTPEQRAYLYDNGISARLYNNMPLDEKEILFYCM